MANQAASKMLRLGLTTSRISLRRCRRCIGSSFERFNSSVAAASSEIESEESLNNSEIHRLRHLRNVGIFAHVDAGKTTVTELMLTLAGVIKNAGKVDDGNTVTDYLDAERERGITIQSAAISFEWGWHNSKSGNDYETNDNVSISLLDTPGHVDFSVEVNRSVSVLDGAVLVVDAVAGVQAQTETVYRAMTKPSQNNHSDVQSTAEAAELNHGHEPLPCLALINKMDKEGCHFGSAVESIRKKLPGANPIPIQLPIFRSPGKETNSSILSQNLLAVPLASTVPGLAEFAGVVDLIHMRAVVWPEHNSSNVEEYIPKVMNLLKKDGDPIDPDCQVTVEAIDARQELVEAVAERDEHIESFYLNDREPSNAQLRVALRRITLSQECIPVMASAALRGRGVEPVLDAVADLLPSPLDRLPPTLSPLRGAAENMQCPPNGVPFGHPLNPTLFALAFKVVHMKGRGGSGDGRVVFARVYSGQITDRDTIQVISPPLLGEEPKAPRKERIGGMLELAGGRFANVQNGVCRSGEVCALVNLKSVVTGDTITLAPKKQKKSGDDTLWCLSGVAAPKPVLTVRLEAETSQQQARLSAALELLCIEDPSLSVQETDSATLLSGLGELHVEVALDRIKREYGLNVMVGAPSVSYRETVTERISTNGLVNYDKTLGDKRLEASVQLTLEPLAVDGNTSSCMILTDPVLSLGTNARSFLEVSDSLTDEELCAKDAVVNTLVEGCKGALKRGPLGAHAMTNVRCIIEDIDAESGLAGIEAFPGSLRAAAASILASLLEENSSKCTVLEPSMSVEISVPNDMVGSVMSDLNGRRGNIEDVLSGEAKGDVMGKAMLRGDVPLIEILGYANSLRSLTNGEGAFSAEYKGHSPVSR